MPNNNNYILTPDGELYHWGIKGMRWGVRRYQNKDGSLTPEGRKRLLDNGIRTADNLGAKVLPKGTKMYRTTPLEKDGNTSGPTYVSYMDADRNLYREGSLIKKYAGSKADDVYEHELELQTDIRIPSLNTVRDIEKRLMADEKNRREVAESWVKGFMLADGSYITVADIDIAAKSASKYDYTSSDGRRKAYLELTNKYGPIDGDEHYYRAKDIADAKNWVNTNDSLIVEQSLGLAANVKRKLIKELQSQGYNAMYDNASIGVKGNGSYNKQQEGVEPLIIFDAKSSLKETNVSRVDRDSQQQSSNQYEAWKEQRDETLKGFQ